MAKGSSIAQRKVRVTLRRVTEEQQSFDTLIPLGMADDYAIGKVDGLIDDGVFDDGVADHQWIPVEQKIAVIDVKDVE